MCPMCLVSVISNNSLLGCIGYGRRHHTASWWFALHSQADSSVKLILFPRLLHNLCLSTFILALNLQAVQCPAHFGTTVIWQIKACSVTCAGSTWEMWHSSSPSFPTSPVIWLEKTPAVAGRQKRNWWAAHISNSMDLTAPVSSSSSAWEVSLFCGPSKQWTGSFWSLLYTLFLS